MLLLSCGLGWCFSQKNCLAQAGLSLTSLLASLFLTFLNERVLSISELQSSDSEDPDSSEDRHWCRIRYSTKQVKESGIIIIFMGGGGGGGCVIILGRFGGRSELICLCWEGGYCVICPLAKLIPPPPDNYFIVLKLGTSYINCKKKVRTILISHKISFSNKTVWNF